MISVMISKVNGITQVNRDCLVIKTRRTGHLEEEVKVTDVIYMEFNEDERP